MGLVLKKNLYDKHLWNIDHFFESDLIFIEKVREHKLGTNLAIIRSAKMERLGGGGGWAEERLRILI